TLPFITIVLIFISDIFTKFWWALLGVGAIGFLSGKHFVTKKRKLVDKTIFEMPGGIMRGLYYTRFAKTMGTLINGGVDIVFALKIAARTVGNKFLEDAILKTTEKIIQGGQLAQSLENFDDFFVSIVSTGEKTGKLGESFNKLGVICERDFLRKMERVTSLFEPIMILLMGLIVCFIVFAILLPIFQLNQIIR
ncbi:MAG: type II secretion system F family protein, partial [Deltaproteobacteria bacterium]